MSWILLLDGSTELLEAIQYLRLHSYLKAAIEIVIFVVDMVVVVVVFIVVVIVILQCRVDSFPFLELLHGV